MTTRYLDFIGGNNGNDGSSFANRKLTLASAVTSLTGGDTVRVMASPAATSLGQSATWTNNSQTVTLTSAVTLNITDCESAWSASSNVTSTASTTTFREGTKSANHVIAGAFTTGLASFFATGTLDCSSYKQISFWARSTGTHAAGVFQVKLCTDVAGVTSAHAVDIPALTAGYWTAVTVDVGSSLNSAIKSVALYCVSDPGAVTVNLDNIMVCKDSTSADSLSLLSLISLNTDSDTPWFAIQSINGTTIKLASGIAATAAPTNYTTTWEGSTATATTYKRECTMLTALQVSTVSGLSMDSMLNIEGGWDRSAMTTQSDVTWVRAKDPSLGCLSTNSASFNRWNKMYVVSEGLNGLYVFTSTGTVVDDFAATACLTGLNLQTITACKLNAGRYIVGCGQEGIHIFGNPTQGYPLVMNCKKIWGAGTNGSAIPHAVNAGSTTGGGYIVYNFDEVKNVYRALTNGLVLGCEFWGTTFAHNGTTDVNPSGGVAKFINCTAPAVAAPNKSYYTKYGQTVDDHRIIFDDAGASTIKTATDQRNTASDFSWKFNPKSTGIGAYYPLSLSVAKIACPANEARTVTLYFRRDSTSLSMQLRVPGRQIAGVATDVITSMAAAINTWSQLTVTFTPTEAGVVEVFADAWGGTSLSGWIDDLAVT